MNKNQKHYFCMALLFDLLLECRKPRKRIRSWGSANDFRDNLSDMDVFCGFSRVITGADFEESKGNSLRRTVSDFKRCKTKNSVYIPFNDASTITAFKAECEGNKENVYRRVMEFKDTYLNESKCVWLVSALIEVLRDDSEIQQEKLFEVLPSVNVSMQELGGLEEISFPVFLTAVLKYTIEKQVDSEASENTFHQWYRKEGAKSEWKFVSTIGGVNKDRKVLFELPEVPSTKKNSISDDETKKSSDHREIDNTSSGALITSDLAVSKSEQKKADTLDMPSEEDTLEARRFCMKYKKYMGLLPLCQIAFYVDPLHSNIRQMYSDYSLCKKSVRKEILRLREIPEIPETEEWIEESFEKYKAEIKEKGLTEKNYFYDGAKYFHRAYVNHSGEPVNLSSDPAIFERLIELNPWLFGFETIPQKTCTLAEYIRDYLWEKEDHPERTITPPLDYLWNDLELRSAPRESIVTEWICRFVIESSCWLDKKMFAIDERWDHLIVEKRLINTQEDLYYFALLRLYDVYMVERTNNTDAHYD